ncbi:hypothetical protein B0T10DRAFT_533871 [Thelonectria olida]|uniref:Uncharacterized protein n=1 Tax=Thelonectria olida TaxID=1576542 RepID=A0A9P9AEC9_9HYPO|nr:hypothetical protein B0T10DRAFT_533871 [Thelonectria olida]
MLSWHRQPLLSCLLVEAIFLRSAICYDLGKFDKCKIRIDRILNGTETFGAINNDTIAPFLYTGPVRGMNIEYAQTSRNSFITLTTQGCKVICEDPIDWYWKTDPSLTLGIISNWILPIIALLAALPYDSLHKRNAQAPWCEGRFCRTVGALLNWLGSPQTVLTATLFNIHQIRKCFHETLPSGQGISGNASLNPLKKDAYYVLSCIGQFKLLHLDDPDRRFLETLIYGLFSPMCNIIDGEGFHVNGQQMGDQPTPKEKATIWTTQLLQAMAFQLRMLRRRGVYPTFLSIFLFFIAYAVSLVLAFAAHSVAFGILISWFPLLVLFSVLDRNPVSADRSQRLISRWMQWVDSPNRPEHPNWWSQMREDASWKERGAQQTSFDRYISDFVGQGRQIGYDGLPYAVLISVYDNPGVNRRMRPLRTIIDQSIRRLNGHRPGSWWVLSVISLALVWLEIGMAFMISYNIPTVGIGCRSASYLVYGCLSSLSWLIHLLPWFGSPGTKRKAVCHFLCLLSTLTLFFIIFAAFSGVLKNCLCRGGLSGYLYFENSQFYRNKDHFDVAKWWWAAAIVGALPIFGSFLAAVFLLMKLKSLWQASEQGNPEIMDAEVDMQWLI